MIKRQYSSFGAQDEKQSSGPDGLHDEGQSTIYALSTAPGRAAIAVVRISGPLCAHILFSLTLSNTLPKPRYATIRKLHHPQTHAILDPSTLILHFPAPHSFTGEDILELHLHGGPAIVKAVLEAIPLCRPTSTSTYPSSPPPHLLPPNPIRPANPGEFTLRAYHNTRLTLPQIESLSATLSATTEQQRRLAVRGASAALSTQYETWRASLLAARGELEALIDFSEDQHLDSPRVLLRNVAGQVARLAETVAKWRGNAVKGELFREGIKVALLGAPNAGKSSLLNAVVGREAAIVSRTAGTTRDVVDVGVDLAGWFVRFGDTAGLRSASERVGGSDDSVMGNTTAGEDGGVGEVEQEGIKRAIERALTSDVVIVVLSLEPNPNSNFNPDPTAPQKHIPLDPTVLTTARRIAASGRAVLVAINKVDTVSDESIAVDWLVRNSALLKSFTEKVFTISCQNAVSGETGQRQRTRDVGGVQTFLTLGLVKTFEEITALEIPGPSVSADAMMDGGAGQGAGGGADIDPSIWQESLNATARQRVLLDECLSHLDAFLGVAPLSSVTPSNSPTSPTSSPNTPEDAEDLDNTDVDIVIAAESLRAAADCLARITGRGGQGDVEEVLGVVFEKFCVGK
ncbi:hypothetical protein K402DRAFT_418195 [Aulographum hederae CBS 113979]|uniref:P-loop containing nucleoside triphosphate hydrolase protein n=1 Tax=Aulographum hederae CBS 113979 TaxID=1176131 RepID=A0A6G1HAC9_9PEZI|nr:hypothetical protein K402DRAFT_418195 [Aulographum hederae CBS 113979]